ncbi:MAG TPA: hypothetical protein VKB57_20250 [Acidimicrobiales bacterium]|nr:hypothetical protein [Acidimicrobiales bacterium]
MPPSKLSVRIRLDGGEDVAERPDLEVHAVDPDGRATTVAVGKDGGFTLDEKVLARARRIVVTAKGGDPNDKAASFVVRPDALRRAAELGELTIPADAWGRLIILRRCIDATIRRCFPWRFLVDDLLAQIRVLRPQAIARLSPATLASQIILPPFRCSPICEGSVEVWRRRCCCPPIIIDPPPPEVPDIPHLPIPDPGPIIDLFPTVPPGPGPDPAPFALQDALFTGGAVDVTKLERISLALRPGIPFPHLCTCGPPVKVGDGFVGEGGAIHVCWPSPLIFPVPNCHDEYAFIVRQSIAGQTVTIYDGVASGQWFEEGEEIHLTSFHPRAVGCREDDFPVPVGEPFVVLQDIGGTKSYQLTTPLPDSADSVQSPAPGSGLLDLDAGPDWACGGDLALRYHFSEIAGASMKALGAVYYRVQWAPANAAGDPAGAWETLPVPAWSTWRIVAGDIVPGSHALGPNPVGGEPDLFFIPFETGDPLVADEEWQDGQFHAIVPTASKVEGRYLVRIEVFDAAGTRLEPATSAFTFRRWDTATTTLPVTFGALTHLFRTDNRPVVADIVDIGGPGAGAGDCKFFNGAPGDSVAIDYRAFHPEPGTPSFMQSYTLAIFRGVSGTLATPALTSTVEIGEGGPPGTESVTLADLLDGEDRCSFAVRLDVSARISNGSGALSYLDRSDIAAFAAQLAP